MLCNWDRDLGAYMHLYDNGKLHYLIHQKSLYKYLDDDRDFKSTYSRYNIVYTVPVIYHGWLYIHVYIITVNIYTFSTNMLVCALSLYMLLDY